MLNKLTRACVWFVLIFMLISCGQTGPLYLPEPESAQEEDKK